MLSEHHSFKWHYNLIKNVLSRFHPLFLITTFYSIVFLIGIIIGELTTDYTRVAEITSMLSTLIVIVLGLDVIYRCWHRNSFLIIVAASLIGANFLDFSHIFSEPVPRILFHLATILAAAGLFYMVHVKKILTQGNDTCEK